MSLTTERQTATLLEQLVQDRILVLDGAMGTMIQSLGLDERAMRGEPKIDDVLARKDKLTHPFYK